MSKSTLGLSKRIGAGVLAGTLALLGTALAPSAGAETVDEVTDACGRLSGQTRFGTAGAIADAFATEVGGVDTAIIANGRNFPDALAASGLARDLNAPILLVEPPAGANNVPLETQSALDDLGVSTIVIVGGTAAVSDAVQASLDERYGTVRRVAGDVREDTAAEIASEIGTAGSHDGLVTAIVATGDNYPDALAGGPISYHGDGTNPFPILLTRGGDVPASTEAALEELGIEQVIVLGGTAAVPATAVAELAAITGNDPIVLAGALREDTAKAVADFAVDELGFDLTTALLADGREFFPSPDALSGGPLGGETNSPILLVTPDTMPAATETFLTDRAAELEQVIALGGTQAIAADVLEDGCTAAGVPLEGPPAAPGNQTFDVTPQEAAENTVSTGATSNAGARTYTVEIPAGVTDVNIALYAAETVRNADGTVTFTNANPVADDTGVSIETVNGLAIEAAATGAGETQVNNVAPAGGQVTFTVDSVVADQVTPVVFQDTTTGDTLSFTTAPTATTAQAPSEPFGVGGTKSWVPAEATTGDITGDQVISSVNKDTNRIVTATATYFYDENDIFYVAAGETPCSSETNRRTLAQFEAELSAADELDDATFYQGEETLPSTFCLEDLAPAQPTVTTVTPSQTTASFTVTGVQTGATVTVYCGPNDDNDFNRATDTQRGQTTTDQDPNTAGFQVIASGLTATTPYDCYVSQTVNGEESSPSTRQDVTTTAVPAAQTPSSTQISFVEADAAGTTLATGDQIIAQFDRAITVAAGDTIRLIDDEGDEATLTCGTNVTCTVGGDTSNVLTATLTGPAVLNVPRGNAVIDTDTFVEILDSTIGNETGDWNLPESGLPAGLERVFNEANTATNAVLPAPLADADVTTDATANTVTVDDADCSSVDAGDVVYVYDFNGNQTGTGTVTDPGADNLNCTVVITTTDFAPGATIFVTYRDDDAAQVESQTLQETTA